MDKVTKLPVLYKNHENERVLSLTPTLTCSHGSYLIDVKLNEVECARCHQKLNPMWVLERLCFSESRYHDLHERYQEELKRLEARSYTKCRHCNQMTPISRS